jgi:hypothetical protein
VLAPYSIGLCCVPADTLRYFLMKSFGGLYLDLDVECYRSVDSWLRGYNLILQSDYDPGHVLQHGVLASVPGHKYWDLVIDLLYQKSQDAKQEEQGLDKVCGSKFDSCPFVLSHQLLLEAFVILVLR